MAWHKLHLDRVYYLHGYLYALALITFFVFSAILVQNQTDVWKHIAKFMPEKTIVQVYWANVSDHRIRVSFEKQPSHREVLEKTEAHFEKVGNAKKHLASSAADVQHIFKLIEGLSSSLYVYAALWDVTNVRLVAIKKRGYVFKNLLCVLYYSEDKRSPGVYVKPVIKELHTKKSPYKSTVIKCPIKPEDLVRPAPLFVGLVEDKSIVPKTRFRVENRHLVGNDAIENSEFHSSHRDVFVDFTVCVPALHEMGNAAQLVEKIEMSRLLGADRIVFYNASISPNVDSVLRMYASEWALGRETLQVVVMPWKLPRTKGKPLDIRYFAQQIAIDDCLFRYKRLSRYMTFHDLDEFLVPIKHENWSSLVAERRRVKPNSIGWLFRCSVINQDRPSPATGYEDDYLRYGSAILGLTSRDKYVYSPQKRPKLIVDPTTIDEMGVHLIFEGNGTTDNLPVNSGLLFHYRSPIEGCTPQIKETRVVAKYGKRLVERFKKIWSKLPGVNLGWTPFQAADKSKCKTSG